MVFFRLLWPLGIDFPIFWEAAVMWVTGLNPYQTLLTSAGPFNYPPPTIFFIAWLGWLPFGLAAPLWNVLSLTAFSMALYVLLVMYQSHLHIKPNPHHRLLMWLGLIFIFTFPFFPEKFNMGNGQINNFILLWCVISAWFYTKKYQHASAFFLAYAISIKLTPAVFLFPFLITGDFQHIKRVGWWTIILFGLSFVFIPASSQWQYYADIFWRGFSAEGKDVYYNQSVVGLIARSLPMAYVSLTHKLVSLVVVGYSWWRCRHWTQPHHYPTLLTVSTCLYLMLHPLAWQHHFVFAVIPLIFLWPHTPLSHPKTVAVLLVAYTLLANNIKQPQLVPVWATFALSHQFFGIVLLWWWALHHHQFSPQDPKQHASNTV